MDKQEYKILSEEIMSLTANERFVEAVEIADRIDWRKVRSFSMLHKISNLYKINRRYEEALGIIQLAYDRNPNNWKIIYSMCELYIELNDIGSAAIYLAKFKKIAPNEPEAYILQYEILEQQEASLEDRIELLEEFGRKYYREEWAYQLAYLYHRVGLATKCVETCDHLITWFGDGPFVIKAMELKMLHSKLSPRQQAVYDRRDNIAEEIEAVESDEYTSEQPEPGLMPELGEEDFHVKTIDMGKFNTINLQKALAESMRELMGDEYDKKPESITNQIVRPLVEDDHGIMGTQEMASEDDILSKYQNTREFGRTNKEKSLEKSQDIYQENYDNSVNYNSEEYGEEIVLQEGEEILYEGEDGRLYYEDGTPVEEELFYEDGTPYQTGEIPQDDLNGQNPGDFGNQNFEQGYSDEINQDSNQAKNEQILDENSIRYQLNNTAELNNLDLSNANSEANENSINASIKASIAKDKAMQEAAQNGFDNSANMPENPEEIGMDLSAGVRKKDNTPLPDSKTGEIFFEDKTGDIVIDEKPYSYPYTTLEDRERAQREAEKRLIDINNVDTSNKAIRKEKKSSFEDVLSLEQDGQISLVVPEQNMLEKQITGQMNLDEMLANWENIKQYHDRQNKESIHQNIMDKTGQIFQNFDEASKNDLLAQLENEHKASKKVIHNDLEFKKVEDVGASIEGADVKLEHVSIWDEVDAAIKAEKEREAAAAVSAGAEVAGGVVGVGAAVAGAVASEAGKLAEEAGATVGGALTASATAGEIAGTLAEGASVAVSSLTNNAVTDLGNSFAENNVNKELDENNIQNIEKISEELEESNQEISELLNETNQEIQDDINQNISGGLEEDHKALDEIQAVNQEANKELNQDNNEDNNEEFAEILEENGEEIQEEVQEEILDENQVSAEDLSQEDMKQAENKGVTESTVEINLAVLQPASLDTSEINSIGDALEAAADRVGIETVDEINDEYDGENEEREFSQEELELFADFMYSKKMRKQILDAVDMVSLAAYVGNVIVTGDSGTGVLDMAKDIIKEIQLTDSNFVASKVAKISGAKMNKKDIGSMFNQLANGALIVERASDMNKDTLENITKVLETTQNGIVIVLTDTKKEMDNMISGYEVLTGYFNVRIDITPMSNNALVAYAKKYAYGREYKIDEERAVLALHQRISELQVGEHNVTTKEIEDIVDAAIEHSKRFSIGTYFSILGGKRYDYEDMIILKEKDFVR